MTRFGRWWLSELLALLPERLSEWLMDRGSRTLAVVVEQDTVVLELRSDNRRALASVSVGRADYSVSSIDDFLRSQGLHRKHVALAVRLAPERIFRRRLLLPQEAARSLDKIVVQDLVGKTPFRLQDIFHDCVTMRIGDKISVWQWVVRRELVDEALGQLGIEHADVAFVEATGEGNDPAPRLALHRDRDGHAQWPRRAIIVLAMTAVLLALLAVGSKCWRQQAVLDGLAVEVAATRQKAQDVRSAMDKLEQRHAAVLRVRLRKGDTPSLLDIWEDATRVLPSDSWLSELRVSELPEKGEQLVVMTGFSSGAANLVALLDRSPLLADASLTAPISQDPVEQRERFVLQAKVRRQAHVRKRSP